MNKPLVIGICGKKQTGKDTVALLIKSGLPKNVTTELICFADPLKEEVARACGVTTTFIEDHKARFRPCLQWWGTEFRRHDNPNYWTEQWHKRVRASKADIILAPGTRYPNEAQAVLDLGGILYRVTRTTGAEDTHLSETEQEAILPDRWIENKGDMNALSESVKTLLKQFEFRAFFTGQPNPSTDAPPKRPPVWPLKPDFANAHGNQGSPYTGNLPSPATVTTPTTL